MAATYKYKYNLLSDEYDIVADESSFHLKDAVATYNDLPITGNTENDMRFIKDTDDAYVWSIAASSGDRSNWKQIPLLGNINIDNIGDGTTYKKLTAAQQAKIHDQNTDTQLLGGALEIISGDDIHIPNDLIVDGLGTFDKLALTNTAASNDDIVTANPQFVFQSTYAGNTQYWMAGAQGQDIDLYIAANGVGGSWTPYFNIDVDDSASSIGLLSDVAIAIRASNDFSDYIQFQTIGNVPEITTIGGCDLKITSDSGLIDFGNNNLKNVGIIYGIGTQSGEEAYLRIGDAATTAHSLVSEDDLMVTGKLETKGDTYIDGDLQVDGGNLKFNPTSAVYNQTLTVQSQGTNKASALAIKGSADNGVNSAGELFIYDEDKAEYMYIAPWAGVGYIDTIGISPGHLGLQASGDTDRGDGVYIGEESIEGHDEGLRVYGYPTGGALKHGSLYIADATSDFHIGAENDIVLNPTGGNVKVEGKLETNDEVKIKVYAQDAEPILSANEFMAMWKDTNDSNRIYLLFRRGDGDQVSVELA